MSVITRGTMCVALCGIKIAAGQTLSSSQTVGLAPISSAVIDAVPASFSLPSSGIFISYNGSLMVTSEIRTVVSDTGQLVLQVTSDFSPANGPSAAAGKVFYGCLSSYGTACSGQIQANTSSQTLVTSYVAQSCTGGGGACSNPDPNINTISISVLDDPKYKTGIYTATLTFTISTV